MSGRLDRALPNTMVDLIRDGAPKWDLRKRGDQAIYSALCRTACSAVQRGWSRAEWAEEVQSKRSMLGVQAGLKNGSKPRTDKAVEGTMRAAWAAAERWAEDAPAPVTRSDVEAKCKKLMDLVADPSVTLGDVDRAVLGFAISEALARGTDRPTLPLRATAEGANVSVKAVRLSFARLDRDGLLVCEVRGVPSGPNAKTCRASAYRLPDPSVLLAKACAEEDEPVAANPTPPRKVRPDRNLMTVTLKDPTPEFLADLARLLAEHGHGAAPMHSNAMPSNVTPIRRTAP